MTKQIAIIISFILAIPLWSYPIIGLQRAPAILSWLLTIASLFYLHFFVSAPPPLLMLLFIMSTFLSFKILMVHNHLHQNEKLNFVQWLLFCYAWFGMNPKPFLHYRSKALPGYFAYIKTGTIRLLTGYLVLNLAHNLYQGNQSTFVSKALELCFLVGLSLMLHFGLLNINVGILRAMGIPVSGLFKQPLKSKTIQEFWSKRWNLAFIELTTIAVQRPLAKSINATFAFWLSFIFSGLLHEMAISLPVKAGYGGPLLYFALQALLILTFDKWYISKFSHQYARTALILLCLAGPIFILFHHGFIYGIIVPIVQSITIV